MKKIGFNNVSIIGVGLIGGSLGLAIKRKKLSNKVIGVGRRKSSISSAKKKGAIDEATLDIGKGVRESDLVIIATPINKVIDIAKKVVKHLPVGAILLDVASTKSNIVLEIEKIVPPYVSYIGTHPIAGSEKKGVKFAEDTMFDNANCIITPTSRTDEEVLTRIKKFWENLGSRIIVMSPQMHDKIVSNISHIPHLIAAVLVKISGEYLDFCGGSFKDATRVALSSPEMWTYVFMENKKYILKDMEKIISDFKKFSMLISNNKKQNLLKILNQTKFERQKIDG